MAAVKADPRLRADPADRPRSGRNGGPGRDGSGRAPRSQGPAPRRRRRLLRGGLVMLAWLILGGAGVIGYFALTLPDTSQLAQSQRRPSVTILAADGSMVATYGDLFGRALTLGEMSTYLPQAVIATEDRRFYRHFGIDPIGLLRAAVADLIAGKVVEGGSTITQQLAKNLFLTPERSFSRKIRETLLALWLEHRFTKNQILEIYLNRVYLGAGTYGVDAAARRYFGVSASRLDLYQSALIAGLLKAPARFNPTRDRELAAARTARVLANMVEAGYISASKAASAGREQAELAAIAPARRATRYFADWIAGQLADFVGPDSRDLIVRTTLDPNMQAAAETAVGAALARYGARDAIGQGALVAMTPDGAVRAMVGGRSYDASQFNRATQAQRQPGSAFKPFVYLAGLEAGLRPSDHFFDGPIQIGTWRPRDFGDRYLGDMTLAEALAQSVNTIAVQVALRAGVDNIVAVAHRLGIMSALTRDASIALGTDAVNLLELTSAYAPLANGGFGVWPYGVIEVRDSAGRLVFRRTGTGPGRVVSPELEGELNDMLAGVIDHGTGRAAILPRPAAGKTGTTQDYRDAWFVGYTADLVAGVWFGNDDDTPMRKVIGGSVPAQTWRNFMLAATRSMPVRPLPSAPPPVALATAPGRGFFETLLGLFRPPPPSEPPPAPTSRSLSPALRVP
jgi:penicillin-binding protein 1A